MEEKNSKDKIEKDHTAFVRNCLFRSLHWLPRLLNLPTQWLDLLSEIFRMLMASLKWALRSNLMTNKMKIHWAQRKENRLKENTQKHAHDCHSILSAKDPKHRLLHSLYTIMTIRNNLLLVSDKQMGQSLPNWLRRYGKNFLNKKGQSIRGYQRRKKRDIRKRCSYLRRKIMRKSNRR